MKYVFKSIVDLAVYCDMKSQQARDSATKFKPKQLRHVECIAEAATYENIANLLRNLEIKND